MGKLKLLELEPLIWPPLDRTPGTTDHLLEWLADHFRNQYDVTLRNIDAVASPMIKFNQGGEGSTTHDDRGAAVVQAIINPIRKEKKVEITDEEFDRRFPDEAAAEAFVEQETWGDEPRCGRCYSNNVYRVENRTPMPWYCRDCRRYFSVRIGGVMYKTRLSYRKWVKATYVMLSDPTGENANKVRKRIKVQRRTAWSLCHRIRESMAQGLVRFSETTQGDETYAGPKNQRKHAKNKPPGKKNPKTGKITRDWKLNKATIFGLVDEETGYVLAYPVLDDSPETLQREIMAHVQRGSTVWTDGAYAYQALSFLGFRHDFVRHGIGEYVNERGAHTNRIESFWNEFKRGLRGTYNYMSDKHLLRYVNEFVFRHNMRQSNDFETIGKVFKGMIGKYLPWKVLVGPGPVYRQIAKA